MIYVETFTLVEHIANCEGAYPQTGNTQNLSDGMTCQYIDGSTGESFFLDGATVCDDADMQMYDDEGYFSCHQGPSGSSAIPYSS